MINTITQVLEQLGLSAQKRAIHAQFSHAALNHDIFLQHIEGTHALNQGLNVELICLSTNALIPLKQFIGVQVAVDQVTDQGNPQYRSKLTIWLLRCGCTTARRTCHIHNLYPDLIIFYYD